MPAAIVANALHIPKSMIRVIKPRIGGGFGAKQTAVSASLSGLCYLEDQEALQADLHPRREPDRIFAPP